MKSRSVLGQSALSSNLRCLLLLPETRWALLDGYRCLSQHNVEKGRLCRIAESLRISLLSRISKEGWRHCMAVESPFDGVWEREARIARCTTHTFIHIYQCSQRLMIHSILNSAKIVKIVYITAFHTISYRFNLQRAGLSCEQCPHQHATWRQDEDCLHHFDALKQSDHCSH